VDTRGRRKRSACNLLRLFPLRTATLQRQGCEKHLMGPKGPCGTENLYPLIQIFGDLRFPAERTSGKAITASDYYWSGTTNANNTTNAWNVNFNNGNTNNNDKTNGKYARCVRGRQLRAWKRNGKSGSAIIQKFMSHIEQLPLYLKLYQLVKFLYAAVENFPKQYKYTLGSQIINAAWRCLDLVLEANSRSGREKHEKILELSLTFDKLKIRLRLAQEISLLSEGQFAHLQTYYCLEVGGMIGGWLKWAANDNGRNF